MAVFRPANSAEDRKFTINAFSPSQALDIPNRPMHNSVMRLTKDLVAASAAPLILSLLEDGESYGYAIIQSVRDLSDGEIEWTDGMLYPVLHRLEAQGFVSATWRLSETGRKRKYYALTRQGRAALAEQKQQWLFVHGMLTKLWGA